MSLAFVKFPVKLAMDPRLTPGARACYAVLVQVAYEQGRRKEVDVVPAPPRSDIADVLGCSENTVRSYLGELAAAGWITETRGTSRRARQLQIFERSKSADMRPVDKPVNNSKSERSSRARELISTSSKDNAKALVASAPPALLMIEGRNVGFDAVQAVCGIDPRSPRLREIPVALNGSRKTGPGIREQFWCEVVAASSLSEDEVVEFARANPERFEQALADAVMTRVGVYRRVMEGAVVTPTALQKWWSDLPVMLEKQRNGETDLVARMRREADRQRQEGG